MGESDAKRWTLGQIDSATVHELIMLYHHAKPRDALPWSWRGSLETTLALIDTDQLRFAPGTRTPGFSSGPYELLQDNLASLGLISSQTVPAARRESAMIATQSWAVANVWKLRDIWIATKSESAAWLEEDRTRSWENHREIHGALFDERFIPQLAAIGDLDERDARQLWERTTDPKAVADFVRASDAGSGDLAVVSQLYALSHLVRGRYHDEVAQRSRSQILHHTFRAPLFDKPTTAALSLDVVPAKFYLAVIIVADAFAAKKIEKRIGRWSENVGLARAALRNGLAAEEFDDDEKARRAAVQAAMKLGVGTHTLVSSVLEHGIDIITAQASRFLGAVVVSPFGPTVASFEADLAADTVRTTLDHWAAPMKTAAVERSRRYRLNDLSRVWPGRIARMWRKPAP